MLKNPSKYERDISWGKMYHFIYQFLLLCYKMTLVVVIAREARWTNHEFYPVHIISPCISMLIYHLGNEQ
jgi:hypothetical protein